MVCTHRITYLTQSTYTCRVADNTTVNARRRPGASTNRCGFRVEDQVPCDLVFYAFSPPLFFLPFPSSSSFTCGYLVDGAGTTRNGNKYACEMAR